MTDLLEVAMIVDATVAHESFPRKYLGSPAFRATKRPPTCAGADKDCYIPEKVVMAAKQPDFLRVSG
jgi:hypothetical protein